MTPAKRLRLLRDLQSFPDGQTYNCDDLDTVNTHKLTNPFRCGCRIWIGAGLVRIEFKSNVDNHGDYQSSAIVPIKSLTPAEGVWSFQNIQW